jgi:UDP-3-O-[3-hydroxymyristoyl] glucosamine N-acyltransferase
MQVSFTPDDIAAITQPKAARGATTQTIRGLAALTDAAPGDLSFLGNAKYKSEVPRTRASVVLLPADFAGEPHADQLYLLVDHPSIALARICARIEQSLWPKPAPGVHSSAAVAARCRPCPPPSVRSAYESGATIASGSI